MGGTISQSNMFHCPDLINLKLTRPESSCYMRPFMFPHYCTDMLYRIAMYFMYSKLPLCTIHVCFITQISKNISLLFTKITTVSTQIEPSDYLTESQVFRSPFKSPIKSPFKSPFKRKLSFGMPSSPDLNLDFLCGLDDTEGIAELFDMW